MSYVLPSFPPITNRREELKSKVPYSRKTLSSIIIKPLNPTQIGTVNPKSDVKTQCSLSAQAMNIDESFYVMLLFRPYANQSGPDQIGLLFICMTRLSL
jgi:hypothetical protein